MYNPILHNRRSIRLKEYDYSQEGLYFVTICVKDRECLFGDIKDGKMVINHHGEIVHMVWNELPNHYHNIILNAFSIMPNHIHGIIEIAYPPDAVGAGLKPAPTCCKPAPICCNHAPVRPTRYKPLSEIVRALKTFSARKINEYRNSIGTPIWQRNYYEHIIRTEQSYLKIADYIKTNPQNWIEDTLYVVKSKDGDCRR